ncbi:MAG: peptidoglycan bridge formation glycyltransferase FemA/FemB family protein [Pseudomonadota bacterium]
MVFDPHYVVMGTVETAQGPLTAWKSSSIKDPLWDTFLESTPRGHFEQTSMWAQVKLLEGWKPLRVVIIEGKSLRGGFQILTRSKSYIGKVGLIMKGPVIASDDPAVIRFIISSLKKIAKSNKIRAIILQPPDKHTALSLLLRRDGFSNNYLENSIQSATIIIDLQKDENELLKCMKPRKRYNIKHGLRTGVSFREGNKNDLSTFFSFMLETCKRQGVRPNPSNEKALTTMWELFSPNGNIKLFIAEYCKEAVSAQIVVPFGNCANLWKFGWSGKYGNCHPNEVLYWENFKWARSQGYSYADLGAISSQVANAVLQGTPLDEGTEKTWSAFKWGFGGEVTPLAEGCVYIYNPFLRLAYSLFMPFINSMPALKRKLL